MSMLKARITALGICIAVAACPAVSSAATTTTGSDTCEIDEIMRNNRIGMDEKAIAILDGQVTSPIEQDIDSAPSVKDSVCIDDIGVLLSSTLPTFGDLFGGVMDKLKKAACNAANSFLQGLAQRSKMNVSDPFGIAQVGIGATTNGQSGMQTSTYDLGNSVEQATQSAINQQVNTARNSIGGLPTNNPNRLPNAGNAVGDAVKNAIKGL